MRMGKLAVVQGSSGQSLVEAVLVTPILLLIVLNAINFGYFLLVALNLEAAPRTGILYSIIGSQTPGTTVLPLAAPTGSGTSSSTATNAVTYLTYKDIAGGLNLSSNAIIQVCSKSVGVTGTGTSQTANCVNCSSYTSKCSTGALSGQSPDSDPEASTFVLNRVDISYTFRLLIPGTPFGAVLLPSSACSLTGGNISCTIHRQVSMRAMD